MEIKKINFLECKQKFDNYGYFVLKNFINKKFISRIINEIEISQNSIKYFDNLNKLRRIEKLYNKGPNLKILNDKFSILFKKVFNKDFLIFKDKFNLKPPGGEGFFAHYDGIFEFIDFNNKKKRGWYEYGDLFINALLALDVCNKENGALELAKSQNVSFDQLIENTKKDGTPALTEEFESKTEFNIINLDIGDIVVFSNTCPHRSQMNNSKKSRRIIYYTYSLKENGSKYNEYFEDKKNSKGKSKALSQK